jgi:predicted DNA-binding WGR domain protein
MTGKLFHIELQARDPERNRWRFYRIEAGRDLFGDWVVRLTYGRIGARGQTKTQVAPDAAAAAKLVRACLRRRQSAPRRIGVAYEVRAKFDPHRWAEF